MGFIQACLTYGSRSVVFATRLLCRPCQGVLAQRAERSMQLWCLYSKLYDRHSARRILNRCLTHIGSSLHSKVSPRSRRLLLLLSASAPLIKLDKSSIIQETDIDEFLLQAIQNMRGEKSSDSPLIRDHIHGHSPLRMSGQSKALEQRQSVDWEMFVDSESVTVWRRPVLDRPSHLCEYLVCGSYSDIQPIAFHFAQTDVEYRRQWDSYTIDLQLLRSDSQSKTDFIRWIVSFPFPLAPREYVLCRQSKVDTDKNMIVAVSKAIPPEHDSCSEQNAKTSKRLVRVCEYYSVMVVVPHTSLQEPGLDFVLLYFDDPQMPSGKFSKFSQSVGAGTGMRDYLSRLRKAALGLQSNPNTPKLLAPPQQDSPTSRSPVDSDMAELGALSA